MGNNFAHYDYLSPPTRHEELYRILLIDDDYISRHSLHSAFSWENMGFRIADEATNAFDAFELLSQQPYHVLLTDIRMPKKTGLELIEETNKLYPDIVVVTISSYEQFDYALAALQLGVKDYLVKPISPHKLMETFQKIKLYLDEQKEIKGRTLLRSVFAKQTFLNHAIQDNYPTRDYIRSMVDQLGIILPDEYVLVNIKTPDISSLLATLATKIADYFQFGEQSEYDLVMTTISSYCIFLFPNSHIKELNQFLLALMQEFYTIEKISVSEASSDIFYLSTNYRQSIEAQQYETTTNITYYSKLSLQNKLQNKLDILQKEIIYHVEENNQNQLAVSLERVFAALETSGINYAYNWCMSSIQRLVSYFDISSHQKIEYSFQIDASSADALFDIIKKVYLQNLQNIFYTFNNLVSETNKTLITKAKEIVRKEYSQVDFSLQSLAEGLTISYGYLCTLFKQITGENFMDYLVRVRMEQARTLLLEQKWKIYEIAEQVGYNSSRYFSVSYKRYFGYTPTQHLKHSSSNR